MKFIRKTITRKFAFFIFILALISAGAFFVFAELGITSFESRYVLWGVLGILFFIAVFFYGYIGLPLSKIIREIKMLLTGKKYSRIVPTTIDEVGVFTYFFNEITKNLEKISTDIVEKERLTSELDIASKIQNDVLPKEAPPVEGLDIIAKTTSSSEVGGDSFDLIQREENTFIYIGDVTGHGVPAGLVMMMVNTLMHVFSQAGFSAPQMIIQTNKVLRERISSQRFMTLVMLRWDTIEKKMHFVGAGHENILVYRAASEEVEMVKSGGIALRMVPDISAHVKEQSLPVEENDVVLLYTDGITEAKSHTGEMFGLHRLVDSLRTNGGKGSAEKIFDSISETFANFILDAHQEDDITMIIVKRLPIGESKRKSVKLVVKTAEKTKEDKHDNKKWSWG